MQTRRISLLAWALVGVAIASPAQARYVRVVHPRPLRHPMRAAGWTPVRYDRVHDDVNDLAREIDKADKADTISEREAADLRGRVADLRGDLKEHNWNGLTRAEVARFEDRINYIRGRLHMEKVDYDAHPG